VRSALGPTVVWQPHAGGHGRKTWDGKDKSVSDKQFRGNVRRVDGHEGQRAISASKAPGEYQQQCGDEAPTQASSPNGKRIVSPRSETLGEAGRGSASA
jgi:hypothetical protein